MFSLNPSVTQPLHDELFENKQVKVFVQRDDLIHPFISGNKWRKLKYNLEEFRRQGKEYLVTFGGVYSNHIVATAAAGKNFGIKTIGIIRGEELNENSNPALRFVTGCGMKLFFVSREDYRRKKEPEFLNNLLDQISYDLKPYTSNSCPFYIVPEGGSNEFAIKGCAEIVDDISVPFNFICCACGTGATLAGITSALKENQTAIGIAVLHGEDFLKKNILSLIGTNDHFKMVYEYHFGGYAKENLELQDFCNWFFQKHKIPIEPIYTGKLFFGLYDLIKKDYFPPKTVVVAVHTGGIFDWTTVG